MTKIEDAFKEAIERDKKERENEPEKTWLVAQEGSVDRDGNVTEYFITLLGKIKGKPLPKCLEIADVTIEYDEMVVKKRKKDW